MRPHTSFMLLGSALAVFTVTASPPSLSVSGAYTGSAKTTAATTVSIGTAPPGATITAVSWARVSGSTGVTATSPTAASTTFSGNPGENSTITAVFRATVTNSFGQTATVDVSVSISAGLAAISPNISPANVNPFSHSSASSATVSFTCAPTCPTSTGPFTELWEGVNGTASPTSGTSSTLTVPPGAAGTQSLVAIKCTVTDPAGRSGLSTVTFQITWT